jgi:hypothetical protein
MNMDRNTVSRLLRAGRRRQTDGPGSPVDGNYHSLSRGSEVFFSDSFGSKRTWYVGLDNFDNRHSKRDGAVQVRATCAPSDKPRSKRAERAARQRVNAAVRRHMAKVGYVEEYGDFGPFSTPEDY